MEFDSSSIPCTCDGLITKELGRALMIQQEDCQAAIFYPKKRIVANIHS